MFDWLDYAVRFKDRERDTNAETQQFIEEAAAARRTGERFYYKALARLGRRLTAWGDWLQEQYDAARQTPLELPSWDVASHE